MKPRFIGTVVGWSCGWCHNLVKEGSRFRVFLRLLLGLRTRYHGIAPAHGQDVVVHMLPHVLLLRARGVRMHVAQACSRRG